ncbi:MAG TPA: type IV pilus biogenesis/stability protein PilW [Steroidobacteraceae bacterium]|jgi:type IV pilus assembly protein PilF
MKHPSDSVTLRLAVPAMAALVVSLGGCGSGNPKRPDKLDDAAVYNTQLGISYLHQGELAVAKDKLDRAVKQDPSYAPAHSARAMLYDRLGNSEVADNEFRIALKLAPHDPDMINNYAVYLCQNGRTDEGVKKFQEAAANALYRTPEAAYTNAGVCLRAAKRDDEARALFIKALQTRPNYGEAAFQLADLQFQQKQFTQARALIDSFLGHFPDTADLLLLGVRVARAQNDQVGSAKYARKLQLDFPDSSQAHALAAAGYPTG